MRHRKKSICAAGFVCALLGAMLALDVLAVAAQTPSFAANAIVKADALAVHKEMQSDSRIVQSLKKGDSVYVDYQFASIGTSWCGVHLAGQLARLGYVDCRGLDRESPQPTKVGPPSSPAPVAGRSGPRAARAEVPLPRSIPHVSAGFDEIKARVVREGVVDSEYIATLEMEAQRGSTAAKSRASLAHIAAGEFAISQNDAEAALEHFEAAQKFAGAQQELYASLVGKAYTLLSQNEYSAALDAAMQARRIAPQSAVAAALSGWARYRLNQVDSAIADWQLAQRLHPEPRVAELLDQALRDKSAEEDYREGETSHFQLRYHGGASSQLAAAVLRTLEEQYRSLQADLRFTPPEAIAVILYTQETFRDVVGAPMWSDGGNDGRIRVPVQGMDTVSDRLAKVLKHELTHSFVLQKTHGHCPTWLNEGIAQWMEGRRSNLSAGPLLAAYQEKGTLPLRYLEGPWTGFDSNQARYAYAWSLAVVETIIQNSGLDGLDRLLELAGTQSSGEAVVRAGLHTTYGDLEKATAEYLQQTYGQ